MDHPRLLRNTDNIYLEETLTTHSTLGTPSLQMDTVQNTEGISRLQWKDQETKTKYLGTGHNKFFWADSWVNRTYVAGYRQTAYSLLGPRFTEVLPSGIPPSGSLLGGNLPEG